MMPYVIQTGRIMMGARGKKRGKKNKTRATWIWQKESLGKCYYLQIHTLTHTYTHCQSLNKKRRRFACCEKTNTMNYSCFGEHNADRPVLHFHIYIFLLPYKTLSLSFSHQIFTVGPIKHSPRSAATFIWPLPISLQRRTRSPPKAWKLKHTHTRLPAWSAMRQLCREGRGKDMTRNREEKLAKKRSINKEGNGGWGRNEPHERKSDE